MSHKENVGWTKPTLKPWAKPCKNEQHIGSIKDLRPQKVISKLTFKSQRTANEYAAKRRIYKRPDQQKYTLSRHTEFCKADRTTWKLTLRDEPQKAVYGYDPALFLVLSVSCWCLAKLIFTYYDQLCRIQCVYSVYIFAGQVFYRS